MAFFKKHVVLAVLSGIGFILSGLWLWNGVKYVSETVITQINVTTTSMVDTYVVWSNTIGGLSIGPVLGTFFILFGLFLLFVGGSMAFSKDSRIDFGDGDRDEEHQ
jgi:hypothetical protein